MNIISVNNISKQYRIGTRAPYKTLRASIRKKMVSERRNELIAELFHRIHFIEKWGRGISLILSREPDTDFSEVGKHFIVTLARKHFREEDMADQETGLEPAKGKTTQKATQKTTQKILRAAEENPSVTRESLARLLGISPEGVKYHLDNLKKKGLIKRIGGRKEGMWVVKKDGDHKT